ADRQQLAAVRSKFQGVHLRRMPVNREHFLTALRVPELDGAIGTRRSELLTVGTKDRLANPKCMATQVQQLGSRVEVPDWRLPRLVVPQTSCRGQPCAVRAEFDRKRPAPADLQGAQLLAVFRIVDQNEAAFTRGSQLPAVGAVTHVEH